MAASHGGLRLVDVSEAAHSQLIAQLNDMRVMRHVWVDDGYAYVSGVNGVLRVIDVADPRRPGEAAPILVLGHPARSQVHDGHLFAFCGRNGVAVYRRQ